MAAFTYKKTSTTSMKVTGILNPQTMVINVDGEDKNFLLFYVTSQTYQ